MTLLIILGNFQYELNRMAEETYRLYPWRVLSVMLFFPLGVYLGIPGLLREYKKNGSWRINGYKLVFILLPLLYFSFFWFIPFSYPVSEILVATHSNFYISMIAAGFIFTNSITKENSG
ncbi:hypothetical protein [Mesobacillus subterraneus]|uniref:Acyltransferase 3 domain-containing protein n=1 Tax=Mesobacillus subterraneus TaxID=285983 RepID=A0A427TMK9_9BACI|nr:hypothetical protein [Mesobacillus subterraneus]RSD25571.1 hypothetical protein EJA10_17390 [Mesobacillus subterraneus]